MKTKMKLAVLLFIFAASFIINGCGKSEDQAETEMDMAPVDSSLVRDHSADVASLDTNGDGNVYQCPMDWNVISDEPGSCPLCKMDLEQFSVEEAQKNLTDNPPHHH